ncbi:hypothetical protein K505DRAFT_236195 [Melanomma pulvis-pyrius CBS 109.77]|uniref:Uncharacterized protein n=1 Tax=Melanomma pulvis-pyrius CBS 109.77 TaxID=1314802 RepID=A0A6A6XKW6_9PLEO|nr:hypothetical protein K505DRAFT_236195 [Melanomma pulvis-pyrius CBS 109.77]
MPPKTSNPPRRKGPAFKPPRPVKLAATEATSSTKPSRPAVPTKKAATARPSFQPAATIISSSESEQEEDDALSNSDIDELMDNVSDDPTQGRRAALQLPQPSPIPPKLLNTLLHHGFEDKKTQIQQGAMDLVETYLQTFVREAIARAKYERGDATKKGGAADDSLQVEDLEKLAPQLVLDF